MFGLHKHRYKLEAVTYAPPTGLAGNIKGDGPDVIALIERCKFGLTTFVWRCQDESCGDFETVEALGQRVDAPQEPGSP